MSNLQPSLDRVGDAAALRDQLDELTDAFVATNDQLLALYQLAELSTASLDPAVAAGLTVEQACSILGARWSAFLETSAHGPLVTGPTAGAVDLARLSEAAEATIPTSGSRLDHDSATGRSLLSTPVQTEGCCNGHLLAESNEGHRFGTADLKLAGALANQLAVMLKLSQLHDDSISKRIIERDHDTASKLAQAALNRPLPDVASLDLAAFNRPARAAGGDYYAAARCGAGLYAALGDVSGKGLPAALIMTTAISATYGAFERCPDARVDLVLADIDRQLSGFLTETGMFLTLAVAYMDATSGRLLIGNAGQSPVRLIQSGAVINVPADGPPLGVLAPRQYEQAHHAFSEGDRLFIGSDGWTDQLGPGEASFAEHRVDLVLRDNTAAPSTELLASLLEATEKFASGTDQVDDLTALTIRHTPKDHR